MIPEVWGKSDGENNCIFYFYAFVFCVVMIILILEKLDIVKKGSEQEQENKKTEEVISP